MKTLGSSGTKKQTRLRDIIDKDYLSMLEKVIKPKLEQIDKLVNSDLKTMTDNVNSMQKSVEDLINNIKLQSYNLDITVMALIEVIDDNGVKIENFQEKIGNKKLEIDKNIRNAAEQQKVNNENTNS